jgi:hypothetical protein
VRNDSWLTVDLRRESRAAPGTVPHPAPRPRARRRRCGSAAAALFAATALWCQTALAQGGAVVTPVASRSWILEAVITGAMFALALVVICRSSRRN